MSNAKRRKPPRGLDLGLVCHYVCPGCGPHVMADEDGCCGICGAEVFRSDAPWYVGALAAARAEEREACAAHFQALGEAAKIGSMMDIRGESVSTYNVHTWAARVLEERAAAIRSEEVRAAVRVGGGA